MSNSSPGHRETNKASKSASHSGPNSTTTPYPKVPQQPSFPEIERSVLAYWEREGTFIESINIRPPTTHGSNNEFVFYDGPPFANGLPHYGHLLTGYIKDIVPRYQTMRGRRVERRFGWDCHGLPAEMESEKQLQISGRQAIREFGIDKFNSHCRTSVLKYTKEWETFVNRQARWVNFERDYKTMDLPYMESVLWAFSELWRKGLVYEGYRVVPYSWACETPLSNFETRLDNSYRPRQDPALTVALDLKVSLVGSTKTAILIWTTTPWTLPSNLAVAVHQELEYAIIEHNDGHLILASSAIPRYQREFGEVTPIRTLKGSELLGLEYSPLFPFFRDAANAFRVLHGDFVSADDGTGVVHMAPGFGEDDFTLCAQHNIPVVCPVDSSGKFTGEVGDLAGQHVFEANKIIAQKLKEQGRVIRHETYVHNYPHCWRTDTPLIYKAVSSWYVQVTAFRNRMVELNQQINWIPSHIRDGQFGKWLEGARDWSISRARFWGTPIPIWKSDNPEFPRIDVYGSIKELERDFGVKIEDLHRPFIDSLVRPNPDDPSGKSMMRRVEDVFDCWFESGSMPFAQVHYPFENKDWFEGHFPADFIVEYVAQTRGWFYTLMVLGTALFDRPPFRHCICHGVVLDEEGKKLSKRLRNYPNPEDVYETIGADALRWYLVSSSIVRGGDLLIDREGKGIAEVVRSVINPLWNAYYFFTLYANADGIAANLSTSSPDVLDRYILAKLRETIASAQISLDTYDIPAACQSISLFIEALNNWYIRRSRERFWKEELDEDKQRAYDTLYTVLVTLTKISAPLLPLITEEIFRGLTGYKSVHLSDWPDVEQFQQDDELVKGMDLVRATCSAALAIRERERLRTRLPLSRLTVAGPTASALEPYTSLLRDELNVKEVLLKEEVGDDAVPHLAINARTLGPRLGKEVQNVIAAAKRGDWQLQPDGSPIVAGASLQEGEYTLTFKAPPGSAADQLPSEGLLVSLDINVTKELEEEGLARDTVRLIQQARRDAGLHVSDRIELRIVAHTKLAGILERFKGYLMEQTLTTFCEVVATDDAHGDRPQSKDGIYSCEVTVGATSEPSQGSEPQSSKRIEAQVKEGSDREGPTGASALTITGSHKLLLTVVRVSSSAS